MQHVGVTTGGIMTNPENSTNAAPNLVWAPPATPGRNPYELWLGLSAIVALLAGFLISLVGTQAYKRESEITALGNTLSGAYQSTADSSGLAWATVGNQLSTVGLVVLVGMAFYFMSRWNKIHGV